MGDMNLYEVLRVLFFTFVPFLLALTVHEFSHAWMAKRFGDNTAELMGRLTLNPFAHADPVGTFILPIVGMLRIIPWGFFGWAKPVPYAIRNFKNPKVAEFWVAAAGPLSNFAMAIAAGVLFIALGQMGMTSASMGDVYLLLANFIQINCVLALFNLVPIHPLDGGKIIAPLLPTKWNQVLEENAGTLSWVIFAVFMLGGGRFIGAFAGWSIGMVQMLASI